MLFIQPTVRRIREEDLRQGKLRGCRQEPLGPQLEPPAVISGESGAS